MNTNDYYKYAALATASYARIGPDMTPGGTPDGATFAQRAAAQDRLPTEQAQYLFNPANAYGATVWNVVSYYGGDTPTGADPIAATDRTGVAATLFQRGSEKVLAIRGTEPGEDADG
jgi:hypothetical protein